MFSRSPPKTFKTISRSRSLTQATATLRISPNVTEQVQCRVEGAPYYSVVVSKGVGCALSGRDLGSKVAKVDLIFYGGCHFACSTWPARYFLLVPNRLSDKHPQSPRLTLFQEAALLIDRSGGTEMPAVLFHSGDNEGSGITLKGTDGGKLALNPEHWCRYWYVCLRRDVGTHCQCD